MHILLIEPDKLQAMIYTKAFEYRGHTVARSATAQTAIQLADGREPDVVVLEIQLPNHNGVEFLYEFRSYPDWLRVPVVVHTFVPPYELTQAATLENELGVHRLLYKPVTTLDTLCTVVQGVASAAA